ncbi:hypothetical protein, partial [Pseudophaeobacter sp.]|uniref:hypothetical protein n=1 Tax=Pseudophaeobacter sp. TaxID=1971739 RepID=UPI003A96AF0E
AVFPTRPATEATQPTASPLPVEGVLSITGSTRNPKTKQIATFCNRIMKHKQYQYFTRRKTPQTVQKYPPNHHRNKPKTPNQNLHTDLHTDSLNSRT